MRTWRRSEPKEPKLPHRAILLMDSRYLQRAANVRIKMSPGVVWLRASCAEGLGSSGDKLCKRAGGKLLSCPVTAGRKEAALRTACPSSRAIHAVSHLDADM